MKSLSCEHLLKKKTKNKTTELLHVIRLFIKQQQKKTKILDFQQVNKIYAGYSINICTWVFFTMNAQSALLNKLSLVGNHTFICQ